MKLNKIFTSIICAALTLGVAACSSNTIETNENQKTNKEQIPTSEKLPLEIVQSGYTMLSAGSSSYLYYGVLIKNPNKDYTVQYPSYTVTAYGEDGSVLSSENQTLMNIAPGDTYAYSGQIDTKNQTPSKLEFKPQKDDTKYVIDKNVLSSSVFTVSNTTELPGEYDTAYTGEVENTSDTDFSSVAITVILKKENEIIYGDTTYISNVANHSKAPFEIKADSNLPEHDSFEIYVQNWS